MSNAFGAPLDVRANCWKLLANDLCMQAISTGTLRLGTSGIQSRNFIPLWHVCSVTEKLIRLEFPQASYQVFNLGGTSMSVKDFARLVQAKASTLLGEFVPLEIAEDTAPQQKQGLDYCCRKLTEYLGLSVPEMESEISGLLVFCLDNYKDN
jgi:UDP-glucose 4-epimerase